MLGKKEKISFAVYFDYGRTANMSFAVHFRDGSTAKMSLPCMLTRQRCLCPVCQHGKDAFPLWPVWAIFKIYYFFAV